MRNFGAAGGTQIRENLQDAPQITMISILSWLHRQPYE
jgi:hypothetical protein